MSAMSAVVMGRITFDIIVLLAFLATATGCTPLPLTHQPALRKDGEIRLYLQPIPQKAHPLVFSIAEISAVRQEGDAIPLRQFFTELKAKDLIGKQKLLASATLPPGSYKGISLQLGPASLLGEDGAAALLVPDEPLFIEQEFVVVQRAASALFLSLDPEKVVSAGFRFDPVFALAKSRRQLKTLLGFATNSSSNTVSVFNKFTMEIVDTIATSSSPQGAALDPRRGWVYIALAGDDAIEVIDVNAGEIIRSISLNFGDEPVEIALSPNGRTLVTANRGSNSASIINATSLRETSRIRLPSEPTWVAMHSVEPRAYVFQPSSNAISVIDLVRRELVTTQTFEEIPVRGAVSSDGSSLYVITRNSPNLLVIDSGNLTLTGRIFVGTGAVSLTVDSKTDLVYVGKIFGDIAVIDPSVSMPISTFRVKGNAAFLEIDNDENSLFVVLPGSNMIQKMDLVGQKVSGVIEVEEGCHTTVLMGER
jgi:DNA-binding beta-propeller fold protein YncE